MLDVLKSAANYLLDFVFRVGPVKFIVITMIFTVLELLMAALWQLFPSWFSLDGVFNGITPEVWFFLDLFAISTGLPLIIGAFVTRFLIRRLPVVG